mgnify:CR=1 FL=1
MTWAKRTHNIHAPWLINKAEREKEKEEEEEKKENSLNANNIKER